MCVHYPIDEHTIVFPQESQSSDIQQVIMVMRLWDESFF